MTIHELDAEPKHCIPLALGDTTSYICPAGTIEADDMVHLHECDDRGVRTGRHVTAHITRIDTAEHHYPGLTEGYVLLTLELYRTWVDGQAGPGDWTERETAGA